MSVKQLHARRANESTRSLARGDKMIFGVSIDLIVIALIVIGTSTAILFFLLGGR